MAEFWPWPSLGLSLLALACGGGSGNGAEAPPDSGVDATEPDGGNVDGSSDATIDARDAAHDPPPWDEHAKDRGACKYGKGDTTLTTVGPNVPHGDKLPFKHVVVLMLENRSFDHYFSRLPEYGVTDVDVASKSVTNPSPSVQVARYHETRYCIDDTNHDWGPVHLQYDNGLMDGFVVTNNPGGERAMGYYDERDIPFYYWLAKTFTISDRHFSSLLGPTWPNRFFWWGATAWGRTKTPDTPPLNETKIVNLLEDAGRSWKIYRDGTVSFGVVFGPKYLGSAVSAFEDDIRNDALPDLSIIDPNFSGANQNDEHPPTNIQLGQKFSARIVNAIMSNPVVWKKTVMFITYDEHGGIYDHVAPPPACVPDGNLAPDYAYDRLGIRVPLMVVSPFAKKGFVSHVVTDHTSITRFIENRFDLPAMTHRDANAWPALDLFDFESPPFVTPPSGAPSAEPLQSGIDWCATHPPGTGLP